MNSGKVPIVVSHDGWHESNNNDGSNSGFHWIESLYSPQELAQILLLIFLG